jgi:hypothetical protein
MTTGTGIVLASILLGGIYLIGESNENNVSPVTWDVTWENDLPTHVAIHDNLTRGGPARPVGIPRRQDDN